MLKAFIAMPFHSDLNWIYDVIKEICAGYEIETRRVDKIAGVENIWEGIINEVSTCNLMIADFSPDPSFKIEKLSTGEVKNSANTNVATEAGYAKAKGKPIVIITSNVESLPFDWKVHLALIYPKDKNEKKLLFFRKSLHNQLFVLSQKISKNNVLQERIHLLEDFAFQNLKKENLNRFLEILHRKETTMQLMKFENFQQGNEIFLPNALRKIPFSLGSVQINLLPDLIFLESLKYSIKRNLSFWRFFRKILYYGFQKVNKLIKNLFHKGPNLVQLQRKKIFRSNLSPSIFN